MTMDNSVQDGLLDIPAERFKAAFIEWWAESEHQGWDGYAAQEVNSFEFGFMNDFVVYCQAGGLENHSGHLTFGSKRLQITEGNIEVQDV